MKGGYEAYFMTKCFVEGILVGWKETKQADWNKGVIPDHTI
jgi:hypothetical protein